MDVTNIQALGPELPGSVPDVADYDGLSGNWAEVEHRATLPSDSTLAGFWEGQPGWVDFDSWPYHELCVILTGRVAIEDTAGGRVEYGPGQSFLIPKGFAGRWVTVEPTTKIFVGIDAHAS